MPKAVIHQETATWRGVGLKDLFTPGDGVLQVASQIDLRRPGNGRQWNQRDCYRYRVGGALALGGGQFGEQRLMIAVEMLLLRSVEGSNASHAVDHDVTPENSP